MRYVDGFLLAVPKANQQTFIHHANHVDQLFLELGALRVVECWEDDVAKGQITDFQRAVRLKDDEAVVFSWVEWPDRATRQAAMAQMETLMSTDPRMDPDRNPMPFDGMRMIFGGFTAVVDIHNEAMDR